MKESSPQAIKSQDFIPNNEAVPILKAASPKLNPASKAQRIQMYPLTAKCLNL